MTDASNLLIKKMVIALKYIFIFEWCIQMAKNQSNMKWYTLRSFTPIYQHPFHSILLHFYA